MQGEDTPGYTWKYYPGGSKRGPQQGPSIAPRETQPVNKPAEWPQYGTRRALQGRVD